MSGTEDDTSGPDATSPDAGNLDAGDGDTTSPGDTGDTNDTTSPDATGDTDATGDASDADTSTTCEPTACGPCGLGRIVCGDAPGDEVCQLPDSVLSGITDDECEQKLIFVDGLGGDNANADSSTAPYKTYAKAHSEATQGQIIILRGGSGIEYKQRLTVNNGVSVLGGFSRDVDGFHWAPNDLRSHFDVPAANLSKDMFGIKALNITSSTVVSNIKLRTADRTADARRGVNNYGAHIVNTHGLTLRGVSVISGAGGVGDAGDPGAGGENGEDGETVR